MTVTLVTSGLGEAAAAAAAMSCADGRLPLDGEEIIRGDGGPRSMAAVLRARAEARFKLLLVGRNGWGRTELVTRNVKRRYKCKGCLRGKGDLHHFRVNHRE